MDDLIIGCSTNYDWSKLKYWVNSVNRSGFKGDKVLILMNCDKETTQKVLDSGFTIIAFSQDEEKNLVHESKMVVHVERFLHIYNFLKEKQYRYVITTDVKDVIFQKDPVTWLEENLSDKNCVFSSESIRYEDEPWGNENLLQTFGPMIHDHFKSNEIFNVGVLAGKHNAIRDLCINIVMSCVNRPIPICDQSTFNFLVSMEPYKSMNLYARSEDGWACQLGTTADPSKLDSFKPKLLEALPTFSEGNVVTSQGKVFTIVHQYDRVPDWRKIIESKYGD